MKKDKSTHAKEWFKIGDNEFGFGCLGLNDEQDEFYAQICFMFHQSIEKYLKGYLVANNIKPEKIHDLSVLCQQCANLNNEFEKFTMKCKDMNQYYIPTRYPTHWPISSKEACDEAYETAKEIIDFIKQDLGL